MKTLILILSLLALPVFGQLRTNLTLYFDYPAQACSTNITFHYFSSSNLSIAVSNWNWEGSQPCDLNHTTYLWPVTVLPHSVWWTVCASNIEGTAFFPSAAEVPPLLRSDVFLLLK